MIPKFRAWNTFHNKWVKHFYITENGLIYNMEQLHRDLIGAVPIEQSGLIVMQSTGRFDTFRQDELFEDDVILWTYFDEWEDSGNARIVYRDGCWKLLDVKTGKEVWDSLFDCLENCSVYLAGNIYENHELMEVLDEK
ncbi:YopX family protein [Streptococcus suis]|uniref:YopX family protein n=1 Tax=Streptococcus suis TaxID=1307 RepID=UPI00201AFB7E|nr:YopX family protein [Streptococcus suis]MCL4882639.1 YopX family protein [Streptococcus suis]